MKELIKFTGLIAAPFAPMHKDGSVNTGLISKYYEFLEKNNITGAFINGTTGEGASLSQKEKRAVTENWTRISGERNNIRIINLVGGTSYQECIENAIHSSEAGIDAIAIMAPYFFKPSEPTQLAEFCTIVGEAVPDLPVYFYHIPSLTGVDFPMIDFLRKISAMLPNFSGIKFTKEDFMDYLTCLNFENGKYDIFWGRDECMLSALALGAKGFVGSTYNYAAPLYYKMINSFNNNDLDEARILQQKSISMICLLGKYGGIATGKAFMRYIGFDCGQFRLPVKNMNDSQYTDFIRDVDSLEMKDLFSVF